MIRKVGKKFVLFSKDGSKRLGTYPTRAGANRRERQVNYMKRRRK